jgi:hypothetical protein
MVAAAAEDLRGKAAMVVLVLVRIRARRHCRNVLSSIEVTESKTSIQGLVLLAHFVLSDFHQMMSKA